MRRHFHFLMSKLTEALLCLLIFPAFSAMAASYSWNGTGTQWGTASSWTPAGVPGAADYVTISRGGSGFRPPNLEIDLGTGARVFSINFLGSTIGGGFYTLGTGGPGAQTITLSQNATIFGDAQTFPNLEVPTFNANIALEGKASWFVANDFKIAGGILGAAGADEKFLLLALNRASMHFFGVISDGEGSSLKVQVGGEKTASSAIFYAPNTYTGSTIIGSNLVLATSNVIPDASDIVLSGKIATGGFDDRAGTLQLTSSSAILDFGNGQSDLAFADSHGTAWSGTLTLVNFNIGIDTLRFGSDEFALTGEQLGMIGLSGYVAAIDQDGYVSFSPVPEPRTTFLVLCGLLVCATGRRFLSGFKES